MLEKFGRFKICRADLRNADVEIDDSSTIVVPFSLCQHTQRDIACPRLLWSSRAERHLQVYIGNLDFYMHQCNYKENVIDIYPQCTRNQTGSLILQMINV